MASTRKIKKEWHSKGFWAESMSMDEFNRRYAGVLKYKKVEKKNRDGKVEIISYEPYDEV